MSSKAEAPLVRGGWRLAGAGFVVALALILLSVYDEPTNRTLVAGQPSPQNFVAPVELQVIDRLATEQRRQLAVAQVPELTSPNASLTELVLGALALQTLPSEVTAFVVERYRDPRGVPLMEVEPLIVRATLLAPPLQRSTVAEVLREVLMATAIVDPSLTEAARSATAASVPAVLRALGAGEVIVRLGDPLSPEVLATLETVGLYTPRSDEIGRAALIALGVLVLALLLAVPLPFATRRLERSFRKGQMASLFLLTIAAVAAQRLAVEVSPNFVVVLLVPLLVAVLVSQEAGLLWAVWMAVITALLVPSTPMVTLLATLIGGVVAVRSVRNVQTRPAVVLAGAVGGVVGGVALVAWVLAGGGALPHRHRLRLCHLLRRWDPRRCVGARPAAAL
jgi:membrane-associated HD superfamily phosphohydrolase